MPKEDLLVNIEVNTKKGKRGVDDLSKSLKENARQSKAMQKELMKLEKEYKSIATAAKKLPKGEGEKLAKDMKKVTKATDSLGKQFDRTNKRVQKASEGLTDFQEATLFATAAAAGFANLSTPIKMTGQITNAALAIRKFTTDIKPAIAEAERLGKKGIMRLRLSYRLLEKAAKAFLPAVREQIQLMKGVQLATVRTGDFLDKFRRGLFALGNGSKDLNRGMKGLVESFHALHAQGKRVTLLFRTISKGGVDTLKAISALSKEMMSPFSRAGTTGAARVSFFRQMLLEFQYTAEIVGKKISASFKVVSDSVKDFASNGGARILAFRNTMVQLFADMAVKVRAGLAGINGELFAKVFDRIKTSGASVIPVFEAIGAQLRAVAAVAKNVGPYAAFMGTLTEVGKRVVSVAKSTEMFSKGLIGAIEMGNAAGIGLLGLGTILKATDNQFLDFIGTIVQFAGVLSLSMASALSLVIGVIGKLTASVGDFLLNTMSEWEKKFEKAQEVTNAFRFVVLGFGRAMGEQAVGNLQFWNDQVDQLSRTSRIAATDAQKSIKILIAEGQALGLSAEQNAQVLKRSADLAATSGRNITDVSLAFAKALAGSANSMESLGIFTDQSTLSHSKFAKEQQLVIENLDKQEKAQLVLNSVFEQTIPVIGAAADQLNTITGATSQYDATATRLQATLGSQNVVFTKLIQLKTALLQTILDLPPSLLNLVSIFVDVAGVVLKVVGTIITFSVLIVSVKSAVELLNFAIGASIKIQTAFNVVLGTAGKVLGVQTMMVTNLKSALIATYQVVMAGAVKTMVGFRAAVIANVAALQAMAGRLFFTAAGLKSIVAGAIAASKGILSFTAALLANPLFIAGAAIVASVVLVSEAFAQLSKEMEELGIGVDKTSSSAKDSISIFERMGDILKKTFGAAVTLTKISIIGYLKLGKVLQMTVVRMKLLFAAVAKNTDMAAKLRGEYNDLADDLQKLDSIGAKAVVTLASSFEDVAEASEDATKNIGKAVDKLGELQRVASKRFEFKLSAAGLGSLGTSFEQSQLAIEAAKFELAEVGKEAKALAGTFIKNKAAAESFIPSSDSLLKVLTFAKRAGKDTKELTEVTKRFQDATINATQAQMQALALRNTELQSLAGVQKQATIEALKSANEEVKAIRLVHDEKMKELDALAKGFAILKQGDLIRSRQLREIDKTREALLAQRDAAILAARAKADTKALDKIRKESEAISDLTDKMSALAKANLEFDGDVAGVAMLNYEAEIKALDVLEKRLKTLGLIDTQYEQILSRAREIAQTNLEEASPITFTSIGDSFKEGFKEAQAFIDSLGDGDLASKISKAGEMLSDRIGDGADKLKDSIMNMDLGKLAGELGAMASAAFNGIVTVFNPDNIQKLANFIGETLSDLPETFVKAFDSLLAGMDKFIGRFVEAIGSVIAALPEMVGKILDRLPEIISKLAQALGMFIKQLPFIFIKLIDALPALISQLLSELPALILATFDAIGTIFAKLIDKVPDILVTIIEKLPDILEALIEGLVAASGDIAAAIVDWFISGGAEKLVVAIVKAIPKLVKAIVFGLVNGLSRALGGIFGEIRLDNNMLFEAGEEIGEGFKKLMDNITGETDKLFSVKDFEDAAKGLDPAKSTKTLADKVNDSFTKGANVLQKLIDLLTKLWGNTGEILGNFGRNVMSGLGDIVSWLGNIIEPFGEKLGEFGGYISEGFTEVIRFFQDELGVHVARAFSKIIGVFRSLFSIVKSAFAGVMNFFTTGLANLLRSAFNGEFVKAGPAMVKSMEDSIRSSTVFSDMGRKTFDGLKEGINGGLDLFKDAGKKMWEGFKEIFTSPASGLSKIMGGVFDMLSPASLLKKLFDISGDTSGKGPVEKILNVDVPFAHFATGGFVGGIAKQAGDSLSNDTVPAMLSAGEFVVPRSIAQDPDAQRVLKALMRGEVQNFAFGGGLGKVGGAVSSGFKKATGGSTTNLDPLAGLNNVLNAKDMLLKEMGGALRRLMEFNSKAILARKGGLIGGFSSGDGQKALLQPGEFVVNRQGVRGLGLDLLGAANMGKSTVGSNTTMNVSLTVNTTNPVDENFVRSRLMPAVKKELKDSSLRGDFLISKRGLR